MENICLDTDVLVDVLRGKEEAILFLKELAPRAVLSTTYITLFELYHGAAVSHAKEQNINKIDELKQKLLILNLTNESVKDAGRILAELEKKGELIDFRDLLIGTTAKNQGFKMKTNNQKHFRKIGGLEFA